MTTEDLKRQDKALVGEMKMYLAPTGEVTNAIELANLFYKASSINIEIGEQTNNLTFYNNAAIRSIYASKLLGDQRPLLKEEILSQLKNIYNVIVPRCEAGESFIDLFQNVILKDARGSVQKHIEDKDITTKTKELYGYIITQMKEFLKELYKDAESKFGQPPCDYELIGLGSIALGQMTPYSDLEFAIIIAEEKEGNRQYFERLSQYVHFRVICLGETVIPHSDYKGVNLDLIVKSGVNFDLGGKTPLGRPDKDYSLINTTEGLFSYLKGVGEDKFLPMILQNTCYIGGNNKSGRQLWSEYNQKVLGFLEGNQGEERAIQILDEGAFEMKDGKSKRLKIGNLQEYMARPHEQSGQLFDVKEQIYRLVDRIIYNLGLIYGVMQQNPWQVVDELVANKIFSPEGGDNLKYAISFATSLRLRAYHYYKVQDDRMDININYNPSDDPMLQSVFRLDKEELEMQDQPEGAKLSQDTKGALFKCFFVTASLRNFLKSYCNQHTKLQPEKKKQFFSTEQFYDDCYSNRAAIFDRLGRHDECLKMHENSYVSNEAPLLGDILTNLSLWGRKLNYLSRFKEAEEVLLRKAIKIIEKINPEDLTEGPATIYGYLGDTYSGLGKQRKAFASYKKSRDILEKIHKKDESIVDNLACAIARVGAWLADNNYYQDAEDSYIKAEELFTKEYQSEDGALFATFLANFGSVYFKLNKLDKALEYHIKALEKRKAIYQGKSHDDIDSSYTNFGQIHAKISKKITTLNTTLDALDSQDERVAKYSLELETLYSQKAAVETQLNHHKISKKIKILKAVLAKLDSQDERVAKYSLELETLYSQKEAVETQLNHSQDHTSHVSDDTAENPYNPVVSLCDDVPLVGDSIV